MMADMAVKKNGTSNSEFIANILIRIAIWEVLISLDEPLMMGTGCPHES